MAGFQQWMVISAIAAFGCLANIAAASESAPQQAEPPKDTYVFADKCPNGASYRLFFYEASIDGAVQSFYDYEGPAGKGTVKTSASPKTMAVRVCRALAEIASDQL